MRGQITEAEREYSRLCRLAETAFPAAELSADFAMTKS